MGDNNITIARGSTSLNAEHVNEVHVNYCGEAGGSNITLVIQVEFLAGSTKHTLRPCDCQSL